MQSMHPLLGDIAVARRREQHADAARSQRTAAMRQARPERRPLRVRFQAVLSFLLTL